MTAQTFSLLGTNLAATLVAAVASAGPTSAGDGRVLTPPPPVAEPVVTSTKSSESTAFPRWTISLSGGGTATFESADSATSPSWNVGGQLEVHRHLGPWFVGAAADAGPRATHPFGAALLVGAQLRALGLRFEASGGAGVERYGYRVQPPGGPDSHSYIEHQSAAYGRATLAAACPLSRQLDALAEVSGHLTATSHADPAFLLGAVGLRLSLP